ncbi:hypothetical protein IG631_18438 [Alternaria alternata]|nr:hypothetical protein IG631_18438 [Alternaria alternata]
MASEVPDDREFVWSVDVTGIVRCLTRVSQARSQVLARHVPTCFTAIFLSTSCLGQTRLQIEQFISSRLIHVCISRRSRRPPKRDHNLQHTDATAGGPCCVIDRAHTRSSSAL